MVDECRQPPTPHGQRAAGYCGNCAHIGYLAPRSKKGDPEGPPQVLESTGAGDRSRTYDLRITNALLYQLSYTG